MFRIGGGGTGGVLGQGFCFGKPCLGGGGGGRICLALVFEVVAFAASAMLACPSVESQRPFWGAWFLISLESHVTKMIESTDIHPDHQMHSPSLTKLETHFRDN